MDSIAASPSSILVAAIAATLIAVVAWRRNLLDRGGAVTAVLLGSAIVASGGWIIGILLVIFFTTSSLLPSKDRTPSRTWRQVLANGAPALAFSVIALTTASDAWRIGAAAALAAAAADTWATEIGKTYGGAPISIRTGSRVQAGTSGGVTVTGTLASLAGALMIAGTTNMLVAAGFSGIEVTRVDVAIIAACGLLGSMIDTLLGGTVQARYACAVCGHRAESPPQHRPGHSMHLIGGHAWLTNSMVNLAATLLAGAVAAMLALAMR